MPVWVHYGGTCVNVAKDGNCPKDRLSKKVKALHIGIPKRYFSSKCRSGDIAIVEVEGEFHELSRKKDYACIPSATTKLRASLASAGYGYDPLNTAEQEKYLERVWFRKERFCDPTVHAGKDAFCIVEKYQFACKGDSGSGVMQPANAYKDYVMGILSRGLDCNAVDAAISKKNQINREFRGSVMTDVRKYVHFICFHAGICEKSLDKMKLKKEKMYAVY
ncbi:unnamed protein product [Strongylus vulgaris]|uniref:Peptidase S1 domain-containing protein n=1 Tax=Strongylus vulgaris TaxID=40348 RepID=A0A3P7IDY0_STRVU|nr:unnamed protein product [Strongylus vulgaris]